MSTSKDLCGGKKAFPRQIRGIFLDHKMKVAEKTFKREILFLVCFAIDSRTQLFYKISTFVQNFDFSPEFWLIPPQNSKFALFCSKISLLFHKISGKIQYKWLGFSISFHKI